MIGTGRIDWLGLNSGRVKPGAESSAPQQLVKIGSANIVCASRQKIALGIEAVSPASRVGDPTPHPMSAIKVGWMRFAGVSRAAV